MIIFIEITHCFYLLTIMYIHNSMHKGSFNCMYCLIDRMLWRTAEVSTSQATTTETTTTPTTFTTTGDTTAFALTSKSTSAQLSAAPVRPPSAGLLFFSVQLYPAFFLAACGLNVPFGMFYVRPN